MQTAPETEIEMDKQIRTQQLNEAFLQVCREILLESRDLISDYDKTHPGYLAKSLCSSLEQGIDELHSCREETEKGSLAYVQLSFLMSGQFSGEHLLKIDFYDKRLYADPWEIDCFWDYGFLFPREDERTQELIRRLRKKVVGIMDYQVYERLPTYRLGQMTLLWEVLEAIVQNDRIRSVLRAEDSSGSGIKVLYGVYMGGAQTLSTITKEQP